MVANELTDSESLVYQKEKESHSAEAVICIFMFSMSSKLKIWER